MSYAEAHKYLGITSDGYNEELGVEATAYAKERGALTSDDNRIWWWLRSPGRKKDEAILARPGGDISSFYVSFPEVAVRPALWVNLESGIF